MSESFIFKDEDKLSPHYIPSLLPHRDEQIRILSLIYGRMLSKIRNVYPRFIQIVGSAGTGKTCSTLKFGEYVGRLAEKEGVDLKHVYLNCKVDGATRYVLYGNLVKKVVPELSTRSLSPEEILHQLVYHLRDNDRFLIVTFDEIDYFIRTNRKEHIIYDLTRIPEMSPGEPSPVVGEIFISRSLDWHEQLDPGEKSTLGVGVIKFPRYSGEQVIDILDCRVGEAFHRGVVSENSIRLTSDITAGPPVNGDIRVGLDLLYYAGTLAENLQSEHVLPEHVRRVNSEFNPTITTEDIESLDFNGKIVLLALVRNLQHRKKFYAGLRDFRERYLLLCEELSVKPVEEFEEYVQDLVCRGIVEMKSLTEFGISGPSLFDLEKFLKKLTERLMKGLNAK